MHKTTSALATQKIAKDLAQKILRNGPQNAATIIALVGDLGAGKTTFVQGFSKGLGVKNNVTSPTFLILKKYQISGAGFSNFYHIDAYRLHSSKDILDLGFAELLNDPKNIIIIEWADKISDILPKDIINIAFKHGVIDNERELILD